MIRRVRGTAAAALLVLVATTALGSLIAPSLWLRPVLVTVLGTALVVALVRTRSRHVLVPTLIGVPVAAALALAQDQPGRSVLGIIPTPSGIRMSLERLPDTLAQLNQLVPPVTMLPGAALLVTGGAVVMFLLAELLAVGCWAPLLAGLPVLGAFAPAVVLGTEIPRATLLGAGLLFLVLAYWQARERPSRGGARAATTVAALLTLALGAATALTPAVLAVPAPQLRPEVGTSPDGLRLSLGLDVRDDLVRPDASTVVTYTGLNPDQIGPLHAYTLTRFDGGEWRHTSEGDVQDRSQLWPTAPASNAPWASVTITIERLRQSTLLLPEGPRALRDIQLPYSETRDELFAEPGSTRAVYGLDLLPSGFTADALRAAPAPEGDLGDALEVPRTEHAQDVADTARRVVEAAGASTPYDQALALQNWLRSDSQFTYTYTVGRPRTDDAVWDFLQDGRGYCVQFATAMIVMLRSLGIPARMAVGFLPGTATTGTPGGTISSSDAHAWPQVYFEGHGWVRFEPTPAGRAASAPAWAVDPEDPTPTPSATTTATATPTATASTTPSTATTAAGGGKNQDRPSRVPGWALFAALAALAAGASVLATRRDRARRLGWDVEAQWSRALAALAPLGFERRPDDTPALVLERAAPLLDDDGAAALTALADALVTARYRPPLADPAAGTQLDAWAGTVEAAAARAVRNRPALTR